MTIDETHTMTTYPTPYRPEPHAGPPQEQGATLAVFDRNRGTERLRVSVEEFNGYPFLRLQVWECNARGEWWPVKGRSVTVKLRECAELSAVLADVARQHEGARVPGPDRRQDPGPASRGGSPPQRRALPAPGTSAPPRPPWEDGAPQAGPEEFDEFD